MGNKSQLRLKSPIGDPISHTGNIFCSPRDLGLFFRTKCSLAARLWLLSIPGKAGAGAGRQAAGAQARCGEKGEGREGAGACYQAKVGKEESKAEALLAATLQEVEEEVVMGEVENEKVLKEEEDNGEMEKEGVEKEGGGEGGGWGEGGGGEGGRAWKRWRRWRKWRWRRWIRRTRTRRTRTRRRWIGGGRYDGGRGRGEGGGG